MVGLERPADERGEAAGLVLQLAEALEVLDPLGQRLDVAEHHRGRCCGRRARARRDGRSSQSSVRTLPRVIALRTRSTRISPPPPGRLPRPAAFSRSSTVRSGSLETLVKWWISGGLKPWRLTCGKRALMSRSSSSYHSSLKRGVQAALHQDLVAAEGDVSWIFW